MNIELSNENIKKGNPLIMIQSVYKSLTKAEQKVADVILVDSKESMYYSVTDLAEKANVGETTVIRFCRKLGFRGYQEFKLAIAQNIAGIVDRASEELRETDDFNELAQKITLHNKQVIKETLSLIQESQFQKAVDAIVKARRLYFFGVGSSGMTASDAQYRFMRLGFNAECATDAHIIAMNCALVSEQDVVVGITSSGSTKDLVDLVELAKVKGAFIICITNHAKSPITQYADAILLAAARENPLQGGAFSSKIGQLHVLDILTTIISIQQKEQSQLSLEKTAKAVLDRLF